MGFTRSDIENARSPEEREELEGLLARYLKCDEWAKKALLPIGVLLTSHPGNRAFLKASVETHKKLGYWITLSYDNYLDPERQDITLNDCLPARDVLDNIDTFIMPHHQVWGGVLYPYFWLLKFGVAAMSNFEYIYCANGDCVIEKPENFNKLLDLMGNNDFITYDWSEVNTNRYSFATAGFIAKTSALVNVMSHVERHFIPFEVYEKYTQEFGNCEARFAKAIRDFGYTVAEVVPGFNEQLHIKGQGTWYDILGFRHIHGEYNYSYKYNLVPPEIKYYDRRYMSASEYDTIRCKLEMAGIKE